MNSNNWTLVDTETTGLVAPIHVVEIAAQRFDGLQPLGEPFHAYLNPGVRIPVEASDIHGYTDDFIETNGREPIKVYEEFRDYVCDGALAAHYLRYDGSRVLVPEWKRLGVKPIGSRGFCTWELSRRVLTVLPTHSLSFLREEFALEGGRSHSALGDVEAVVDLLTRIVFPKMRNCGFDSIDQIMQFSEQKPLLMCRCQIEGIDYDELLSEIAQRAEEERRHEQFISDVELGHYSLPALLVEYELIDETEPVYFKGKNFQFTGAMAWGTRPQAKSLVEARGGKVAETKVVNNDVDYLVLGEDPQKGWTSLLNGSKLRRAFLGKIKNPPKSYRIIREEVFLNELLEDGET